MTRDEYMQMLFGGGGEKVRAVGQGGARYPSGITGYVLKGLGWRGAPEREQPAFQPRPLERSNFSLSNDWGGMRRNIGMPANTLGGMMGQMGGGYGGGYGGGMGYPQRSLSPVGNSPATLASLLNLGAAGRFGGGGY